jgi:hypothetical protein
MAFIQSIIKNTRQIVVENKATSTATTSGLLYDLVAGELVAATSSSTTATLGGVANQSIAAAESLAQCPTLKLDENDVWLVDSTNSSNVAHNGQYMVVGANAGVINNTGTTDPNGVVKQVGVFGAAGDKKILVSFLK